MKADAAHAVQPGMSGLDWVLTSPARLIDWAAEALLERATLLVDRFRTNSNLATLTSEMKTLPWVIPLIVGVGAAIIGALAAAILK